MISIIEIHWSAQPHLARMGIKVKAAPLDPRAEGLFSEIRLNAQALFPGCVTLVRIATKKNVPAAPLRITGASNDQHGNLQALQAIVDNAVAKIQGPDHLEGEEPRRTRLI